MNDGSLWCRTVQTILKNSHSLHGRQQYEAPMHVVGNHVFAYGLRQKQRRNETTGQDRQRSGLQEARVLDHSLQFDGMCESRRHFL